MSRLIGSNAVTTRTRSSRHVVTTRSTRPCVVDPRLRYRSSPSTISMPRSTGPLRTTCSASSGMTLCRVKWPVFASSQSKSISSSFIFHLKCTLFVGTQCKCSFNSQAIFRLNISARASQNVRFPGRVNYSLKNGAGISLCSFVTFRLGGSASAMAFL